MWTPILIEELEQYILTSELHLENEERNFWNLIKVVPHKWQEKEYGNEGGGFWVVALFGNQVIYYNDIEEGFNISDYVEYGLIENYYCCQDELDWTIKALYLIIKRMPSENI